MQSHAYRLILSFGSNQGDRESHFVVALKYLRHQDPSFQLLKESPKVETVPFQRGETFQNPYLNFVCDCKTSLHPLAFYQNLIVPIEDEIGHSRTVKWASRALDIDILLTAIDDAALFSQCRPLLLESENFQVPHKRLLDLERKILQDLLKETFNLTHEHLQCHFSQIREKN